MTRHKRNAIEVANQIGGSLEEVWAAVQYVQERQREIRLGDYLLVPLTNGAVIAQEWTA